MSRQSGRVRAVMVGLITCFSTLALAAAGQQAAAPVPVKLLIWAKRAGTVSGGAMQVAIDGKAHGALSNLDEQMVLDVGNYEPGLHSFALTDIKFYNVDPAGTVQEVPGVGSTCAGQFVIQPFQTYYFLVVNSPDFHTLQCVIQ